MSEWLTQEELQFVFESLDKAAADRDISRSLGDALVVSLAPEDQRASMKAKIEEEKREREAKAFERQEKIIVLKAKLLRIRDAEFVAEAKAALEGG